MSRRRSDKILKKGFIIILVLSFLFKIVVAAGILDAEWEKVLATIIVLFVVCIFIIQTIEKFGCKIK